MGSTGQKGEAGTPGARGRLGRPVRLQLYIICHTLHALGVLLLH